MQYTLNHGPIASSSIRYVESNREHVWSNYIAETLHTWSNEPGIPPDERCARSRLATQMASFRHHGTAAQAGLIDMIQLDFSGISALPPAPPTELSTPCTTLAFNNLAQDLSSEQTKRSIVQLAQSLGAKQLIFDQCALNQIDENIEQIAAACQLVSISIRPEYNNRIINEQKNVDYGNSQQCVISLNPHGKLSTTVRSLMSKLPSGSSHKDKTLQRFETVYQSAKSRKDTLERQERAQQIANLATRIRTAPGFDRDHIDFLTVKNALELSYPGEQRHKHYLGLGRNALLTLYPILWLHVQAHPEQQARYYPSDELEADAKACLALLQEAQVDGITIENMPQTFLLAISRLPNNSELTAVQELKALVNAHNLDDLRSWENTIYALNDKEALLLPAYLDVLFPDPSNLKYLPPDNNMLPQLLYHCRQSDNPNVKEKGRKLQQAVYQQPPFDKLASQYPQGTLPPDCLIFFKQDCSQAVIMPDSSYRQHLLGLADDPQASPQALCQCYERDATDPAHYSPSPQDLTAFPVLDRAYCFHSIRSLLKRLVWTPGNRQQLTELSSRYGQYYRPDDYRLDNMRHQLLSLYEQLYADSGQVPTTVDALVRDGELLLALHKQRTAVKLLPDVFLRGIIRHIDKLAAKGQNTPDTQAPTTQALLGLMQHLYVQASNPQTAADRHKMAQHRLMLYPTLHSLAGQETHIYNHAALESDAKIYFDFLNERGQGTDSMPQALALAISRLPNNSELTAVQQLKELCTKRHLESWETTIHTLDDNEAPLLSVYLDTLLPMYLAPSNPKFLPPDNNMLPQLLYYCRQSDNPNVQEKGRQLQQAVYQQPPFDTLASQYPQGALPPDCLIFFKQDCSQAVVMPDSSYRQHLLGLADDRQASPQALWQCYERDATDPTHYSPSTQGLAAFPLLNNAYYLHSIRSLLKRFDRNLRFPPAHLDGYLTRMDTQYGQHGTPARFTTAQIQNDLLAMYEQLYTYSPQYPSMDVLERDCKLLVQLLEREGAPWQIPTAFARHLIRRISSLPGEGLPSSVETLKLQILNERLKERKRLVLPQLLSTELGMFRPQFSDRDLSAYLDIYLRGLRTPSPGDHVLPQLLHACRTSSSADIQQKAKELQQRQYSQEPFLSVLTQRLKDDADELATDPEERAAQLAGLDDLVFVDDEGSRALILPPPFYEAYITGRTPSANEAERLCYWPYKRDSAGIYHLEARADAVHNLQPFPPLQQAYTELINRNPNPAKHSAYFSKMGFGDAVFASTIAVSSPGRIGAPLTDLQSQEYLMNCAKKLLANYAEDGSSRSDVLSRQSGLKGWWTGGARNKPMLKPETIKTTLQHYDLATATPREQADQLLCLSAAFMRLSSARFYGGESDSPIALRILSSAFLSAAIATDPSRIPQETSTRMLNSLSSNDCTNLLFNTMRPLLPPNAGHMMPKPWLAA